MAIPHKLSDTERLQEGNEFLSFATKEFAAIKKTNNIKSVHRCSKCIASIHFAELSDGVCDLCSTHQSTEYKQGKHKGKVNNQELKELHDVLLSGCGKGSQLYDALVMFSGGKDSTYLLHKLKTDYPALRILAVTIDSGFASGIALQNAKNVANKIEGIDFMIYKARKELFYNAFRYALTHPNGRSSYLTLDLLDGELTFDIGRNLAASMQIPLFIAGTSTAQLRLLHNLDWFERPREVMLSKRTHTTGGYAITDLSEEKDLEWWWDGTKWPKQSVPRNILPFHAWDYDESFVQSEVVRLGYIEPGADNPLATNNNLIPLMVCIDYKRNNFCSFEPEFALLVREGRADRDFWMNIFDAAAYLSDKDKFLERSVDDVIASLDLTRSEVGL